MMAPYSRAASDIVDEFQQLASTRYEWERYWRDIAKFVLPHTSSFDTALSLSGPRDAMSAVIDTPAAARRSKDLYDMTSLWGIERLTAGMLTLKTPESNIWHDIGVDDDYGYEPTHEEKVALEKLRDYLFKVRANPKSGFWSAHKAAIRSMCAFGDGWMFIEEVHGGRLPYRYEYAPLADLFPANGPDGRTNRMFRCYDFSAVQVAQKWPDSLPPKIRAMADDPQRRHQRVRVLHAITPRPDGARIGKLGVAGARFGSYYCLPEERIMLGEGGYWDFPYVRYAWNNSGLSPFSEGPVAIALGEIKSLNEMSKNELISHQVLVRPPIAVAGKNMQRLNFNPGAVNPGLINGEGQPLFAPLNAGVRPDFASTIIEARRLGLREMLYLNLWQILLESPDMTATEALIRAQEKGELLGPVGISMNDGLSMMVDREIGIIGRKGAFAEGSPLAMPETMSEREVAPTFTSPLDRLRRMGELVGVQRLTEVVFQIAQFKPEVLTRLDVDEVIDTAQEILGAPTRILVDRAKSDESRKAAAQMQNAMGGLAAAEGSGNAMRAIGEGGQALAAGAEQAAQSPAIQNLLATIQRAGGSAPTRTRQPQW